MSVIPCKQNAELKTKIVEFAEVLKTQSHQLGSHGCNTKDAPWGDAVAAQINASLPQADLRVIVNRAMMELWKRNLTPKPERPVPQRSQFAAA